MPIRSLSMRKIRELIRLKYEARLSHEQIAEALSDAEVLSRIAPGTAGRAATVGARGRTLPMCKPISSART